MRKFARKTLAVLALGIFVIALKSYFWAFFGRPSERQSLYLVAAGLVACVLAPLLAHGLMPGRMTSISNNAPPWVERAMWLLALLFFLSLVISLVQLRRGYPTVDATGYLRHTGRGLPVPIGVDEYWQLQRAVVRIFASLAALISGSIGISLWFHWEPPSKRDSLL